MIKLGEYQFGGPFTDVSHLQDSPGIYAILDQRQDGFYVLDIGESGTVRSRVQSHDRTPQWVRQRVGRLHVAVGYTGTLQERERCMIEQRLRQLYNPPCGDR